MGVVCGGREELGKRGQDQTIQGPDAGAAMEIGTPRSPGTQKSLKFLSTFRVPLPSLREESGEGLFLAQAVLGSSPRCPLTPPPPGGEARVPGFSLRTRGACQAHGQAARRLWGEAGDRGRLTSGPRQVRGGDTEAEQWWQ